jgi:mono/diheme cytochrome c family protein
MKKMIYLTATGVIGLLASVGTATAQPAAAPVPTYNDAADGAFAGERGKFGETSGEAMYRRVCAACHMPDAGGAVGGGHYPALAKNVKLKASGYPVFVVLHGLNGMPPIGDMMSDQQVADVVNYVRTHFGNKYKDAVTAADAKALR